MWRLAPLGNRFGAASCLRPIPPPPDAQRHPRTRRMCQSIGVPLTLTGAARRARGLYDVDTAYHRQDPTASGTIFASLSGQGVLVLIRGTRRIAITAHTARYLEMRGMGAGKKAKNVAKTTKGKAKEATGKATGNESLELKGRAEQAAGDAKQTAEKAKDTLKH